MATRNYVVKQGDCMASIAIHTGFFWKTLWDLPENSSLKGKRKDPYVLLPGDVVVIPDVRLRIEERPTDSTHKFVRKGVPEKLRVVVLDDGEQPIAGSKYTLEIDGKSSDGVTGSDGVIEHPIRPNACQAHLIVGEGDSRREYKLNLGHMDPIDTISGQQARLFNLGFYDGPVNGKPNGQMRTGVMMFQKKNHMEATGDCDAATQDKLKQTFGC
jgi:hypothetical protein